jgi:hypothetical protein
MSSSIKIPASEWPYALASSKAIAYACGVEELTFGAASEFLLRTQSIHLTEEDWEALQEYRKIFRNLQAIAHPRCSWERRWKKFFPKFRGDCKLDLVSATNGRRRYHG